MSQIRFAREISFASPHPRSSARKTNTHRRRFRQRTVGSEKNPKAAAAIDFALCGALEDLFGRKTAGRCMQTSQLGASFSADRVTTGVSRERTSSCTAAQVLSPSAQLCVYISTESELRASSRGTAGTIDVRLRTAQRRRARYEI